MSEIRTPVKKNKQVSFSPIHTPGLVFTEDVNDDEEEKLQRKMQEEAKRRRSSFHVSAALMSSPEPPKVPNQPVIQNRRKSMAIRKMAPAALEDLFKNCIKLSTENKINVKNTWNLNLIDHIDEVIESSTGDQSNFQVASSTLDASMKIYSSRVDSVHSDTYKVLGGLNRADGKQAEEDEEDELEVPNENGEVVRKEKKEPKKKKATGGSTIETNVSKLNLVKFEMEYAIQPLCHSSLKDFEVGSAKSLLLNHLMVSERFEVVLDQEKYRMFEQAREDLPEEIQLDLNASIHLDMSTQEVEAMEIVPQAPLQFEKQDVIAPMEEDVGPTLYDADFGGGDSDNEFQPVLATNTSINAIREDKPVNVVEHLMLEQIHGDQVHDLANAYSYVQIESKLTKKNWTGLAHWKVTKKPGEKKKTDRKKKEKDELDFENPTCDFDTAFECSTDGTAHTMAASTLTKNANATNLLPEDVHYKLEDLMKPFNLSRQQVSYVRKPTVSKSAPQEEPDGEIGYGGDDDHGDDDAEIAVDPVEMLIDVTNIVPIQLVELPKMAQKMNIGYAKISSKVDVKQLKENIWDDIRVTPVKYFSQMYIEVEQKQQSSISFAFLCLLHIANEKGLEITGREDLSDMKIKLKN
jgi:condensin complex subunit 2